MRNDSSNPSDVVRSYLASFDNRDPDEIAAHVSDDFVNHHTSALATGSVGKAAYLDRLPEFLDSMPGLEYRIDELIASGADVAVFYTMTGRWQDEHNFQLAGAQRFRVEDGLIVHRSDYWDSAVFQRQIEGST